MKSFFRIVLTIVNLILAVALLLADLAGNVKPSSSIYISLLSYGYFYILVANMVCMVLWLCLRSRLFLLSLAVILFKVNYIPRYFQLGGTEETEIADESSLKIMSFNTHVFRWTDTSSFSTLKLIDDEQPDIICFQEFTIRLNYNILDSMRARKYLYIHSRNKAADAATGTSVFSRYPIVNKGVMNDGRAVFADIRKNDSVFRIYSIHLDSYHLDDNDKSKIDQIAHGNVDDSSRSTLRKFKKTLLKHEKEVATLGESIEQCGLPMVLCGDFNDPPASYAYNYLRQYFKDSYCEQGSGRGSTFNGMFPNLRIDYVFHDENFKVLAYKVVDCNISDHYPLIVTLQRKTAESKENEEIPDTE